MDEERGLSSDAGQNGVAKAPGGVAADARLDAPARGGADDVVLSVRGVSKCYHIYSKPRDRLKQIAARGMGRTYYHPFWALKGVSFDVKRGEAVGIVGCNGSGKSTLLQIIAGTLTPTEGEVEVRGRVAALLELGSGFNPEFTGRDNIFLNGAILGIGRKEMERKFDEIAAFADIGEFIDQPVKMYSSGMHARLAFSVAISVEPDILILDEILAVGDMGFQQKCVARMRRLLDSGVTLLFVSHSPDAVKSLCRKGLLLVSGQPAHWGSAEDAVSRYIGHIRQLTNEQAKEAQAALSRPVEFRESVPNALRYGSGHAQVEGVRLLDERGEAVQAYTFGEWITVEAVVRAQVEVKGLDVAFLVRDAAGVDLFGSGTCDERVEVPTVPAGGSARVRFRFKNCLRDGAYGISLTLTRLPERAGEMGLTLDHVDGCIAFRAISDPGRVVQHKVYQPVTVTCEVQAAPAPAAAVGTMQLAHDVAGR